MKRSTKKKEEKIGKLQGNVFGLLIVHWTSQSFHTSVKHKIGRMSIEHCEIAAG